MSSMRVLIPFLLAPLLWLTGCRHKDILCPGDEPRAITVRFMWDLAEDADPAGMTAYFFPLGEGTRLWRFDIAGREGGSVELPPGEYRFLAVNNDLPGVTFSGQDSFDGFVAQARTSGGDSRSLAPTGMLYGCTVERVEVSICGVTYITPEGTVKECPQGLLRCHPDSLATVYNVRLEDCKGLDNIRSVNARLYGEAPSLLVAERIAMGQSGYVNIAFAQSGTCLSGSTTGFGAPAGHSPEFTLEIRALRADGTVIAKSVDVTGQVINSINPRNVFIILEGLEFPEGGKPDEPGGDVGIEVGVDGWNVIEIEIDTSLP